MESKEQQEDVIIDNANNDKLADNINSLMYALESACISEEQDCFGNIKYEKTIQGKKRAILVAKVMELANRMQMSLTIAEKKQLLSSNG